MPVPRYDLEARHRGGDMSAAFVRTVLIGTTAAILAAGCAATAPPLPASTGAPNGASPARTIDRDVIQHVLGTSVQVVLERNGERFRTGSGVVIVASPEGGESECLVLSSGHTFAGVNAGDASETYVLLDRHHGAATKVRAELLARRESEQVDLALLRVRAPRCLAAPLGRPPALGDRIWIVGFPWGRQIRLIGGMVSEVNLDDNGDLRASSSLVVDASVAYGMSGGGVFDALTGHLVGLIEGYGTARVPFGEKPTLQYIDVPVPGETYVTSLATIEGFLRESGQVNLTALRR
jgi:Trypsin-like peptidase domain